MRQIALMVVAFAVGIYVALQFLPEEGKLVSVEFAELRPSSRAGQPPRLSLQLFNISDREVTLEAVTVNGANAARLSDGAEPDSLGIVLAPRRTTSVPPDGRDLLLTADGLTPKPGDPMPLGLEFDRGETVFIRAKTAPHRF